MPKTLLTGGDSQSTAIEVPLKEKMIEKLYCLENNNDDLYQSLCIHPKSVLKYYYGLNCVPLKFMS